jgi:hypothetical protein
MTNLQLDSIGDWFKGYVDRYYSADGTLPAPLQLKVEHSEKVALNARQLAEDLGWDSGKINCAEALGILHDVGRFSQYAEFGTFSDRDSINHGERGWEILCQNGLSVSLAAGDQKVILDGVRYHNLKTVPESLPPESLAFVRLIRDADKLDIFRVVLEAVHRDGFQELPAMLPQIDLQGPVNPVVVAEILEQQHCSIEHVLSLSDFLLMQLSWVYDLNYEATFQKLLARNILDELEDQLPRQERVEHVIQAVRQHGMNKLNTLNKLREVSK